MYQKSRMRTSAPATPPTTPPTMAPTFVLLCEEPPSASGEPVTIAVEVEIEVLVLVTTVTPPPGRVDEEVITLREVESEVEVEREVSEVEEEVGVDERVSEVVEEVVEEVVVEEVEESPLVMSLEHSVVKRVAVAEVRVTGTVITTGTWFVIVCAAGSRNEIEDVDREYCDTHVVRYL